MTGWLILAAIFLGTGVLVLLSSDPGEPDEPDLVFRICHVCGARYDFDLGRYGCPKCYDEAIDD